MYIKIEYNKELLTLIFYILYIQIVDKIELFKFILTLVDDFSKATWNFMLKYKSKVLKNVISFVAMIETQFWEEGENNEV